jgi:peptide/nickel transport system substrate-binding protein
MTNKLLFGLMVILLLTSFLLVGCTEPTTTATSAPPVQTTSATSTPVPSTSSQTTSTSPAAAAKWWGKLGTPQYGGSYSLRATVFPSDALGGSWYLWLETLWCSDWALDRNTWSFQGLFTPEKYRKGLLAESWEQPDGQTIIVHLRKGVSWQNKVPVNGREFTSDDVIQHYDRIRGTGSGYTAPSKDFPKYAASMVNWDKFSATDKYTVVFKFKQPGAANFDSVFNLNLLNKIAAPESEKEEGDTLKNPKKPVGTGPWMVSDYVEANSMTYTRNPNYWGYDERYPKNKLPYADELKLLIIPDTATSLAALRTGKLDLLTMIGWQDAQSMKQTNSDLQQIKMPFMGNTLTLRCDKAPFTDIKVRKALQKAIDRESMAKNYFGGTVDGTPAGMISPAFKGYAFDYAGWSQTLKDEYTYDPAATKKLLADAGYPDGFKTNAVTSSGGDLQALQVFKAYLLDVGVDMEIKTVDPSIFFSFINAGKHDQMVYSTATGSIFDINRSLQSFYSKSPQDLARVTDTEYDSIYEKYNNSTSDEVARLCVAADKYSLEQHWVINSFPIVNFAIYQPYLKGFSGEYVADFASWDQGFYFTRMWVDQTLKK